MTHQTEVSSVAPWALFGAHQRLVKVAMPSETDKTLSVVDAAATPGNVAEAAAGGTTGDGASIAPEAFLASTDLRQLFCFNFFFPPPIVSFVGLRRGGGLAY